MRKTLFALLLLGGLCRTTLADQSWDGDNAVGNFSFANNWFGDTVGGLSGFGFGNGNLHFAFRNNSSQTSIFYDFSGYASTNDIFWDSTFGAGLTWNGNGQGMNFNQRLENDSSFTQTIGSSMNLSGAKNGATQIELNPVNGDFVINGTIFNDNSKSYFVYGNNGRNLTVASTLGTNTNNSAVSFNVMQNSNVFLSAAQTFSGGLYINAGTVTGSNSAAAFGGGTITLGSTSASTANAGIYGDTHTFANAITVASSTTGTLTIGNTNNASAVFSGAIALNHALSLSAGTGTGTLNLTGGFTGSSTLTTDSGAAGYVNFGKSGNGTTFTGNLVVNTGVARVSTATSFGSSNTVTINSGATFDINGNNQTIAGLTGSGTATNTNAAVNTLTLSGTGSYSFAGSISGSPTTSMALAKTGVGTQTLTGSNLYSGSTIVSGGILKLANTSGVALAGNSSVTLNSGGTLLMGANNQINQATLPGIKVSGGKFDAGGFYQGTGGTPAVPNSGTIGLGALTMTVTSIIDLTATSVLHFSDSSASAWTAGTTLKIYDYSGIPITGGGAEQILFGGSNTGLTASQLLQVSFYSDQGNTIISSGALILADGEIVPVAVPEPGTWVAAALSLGAIALMQRRRLARRKPARPSVS